MLGVKAIIYLLTQHAPLTAVVPAARIMPGDLPENVTLPAIGVAHVSMTRNRTVSGGSGGYCAARVQVTIQCAKSAGYPAMADLMSRVNAALHSTRGTISGVNVDSLLHELDGPVFEWSEPAILQTSIDYRITYNE